MVQLVPSCLVGRGAWLAIRSQPALPIPYCHIRFPLLHKYILFSLQNPKVVYRILFRAVSETSLRLAADPQGFGCSAGNGRLTFSDDVLSK